jgi:hypothetical protein
VWRVANVETALSNDANGVVISAGGEAAPEETTLVGIIQILLDQKIKKIHTVD